MNLILAGFPGQGRLTLAAVAERDGFRRSVQIKAENPPEHSASDDEALAISLEVKPLGSRPFVFCKRI